MVCVEIYVVSQRFKAQFILLYFLFYRLLIV